MATKNDSEVGQEENDIRFEEDDLFEGEDGDVDSGFEVTGYCEGD